MAIIDTINKTIHFKIVYYGPGTAGKTSSIRYLHSQFEEATKSTLNSLSTHEVRTLWFDCIMPGKTLLSGFSIHLHCMTKPGAMLRASARKADLQDCDGVIFVADSQRIKLSENLRYLREMVEVLHGYNRSLQNLPLVFQYNKRDLPEKHLTPVALMDEYLNPVPWPRIPTVADHYAKFGGPWKTGDGVMEAFSMLTTSMFGHIQNIHST
jgi:signal recognition particle receptor subunit beta